MARQEDFNERAMERKIEENLKANWTKQGIVDELRKEQSHLLSEMRVREERCLELADQIDYMKEKHGVL